MTPPPSITLRQLAYFAVVAEEGSLTAVAERIHLSQSALSTAVSELERLLDVQLFIRHARGLSLCGTASGCWPSRGRCSGTPMRCSAMRAGSSTS
ncbi:LysR family transcriptional regulator [Brachybacterium paraconglomeratum]